jgi:hypothetical protein
VLDADVLDGDVDVAAAGVLLRGRGGRCRAERVTTGEGTGVDATGVVAP